jgi:hypothetical protein
VIKTVVSALLLGVLAGGVWWAQGRPQQPLAASATPPPPAAASEPEVAAVDARPLPVPDPGPVAEEPVRRAAPDKRTTRPRRARSEPLAARPSATPAESAAPAAAAASVEPATRVAPEPVPSSAEHRPRPEPAPQAQGPDDLVEMQQVAAAEQLLARSPERALALVRQGDARFARGYFQQERAYITIMALIRLGRVEEARTRAASFARRFPELPYGARIRSALEAAVP